MKNISTTRVIGSIAIVAALVAGSAGCAAGGSPSTGNDQTLTIFEKWAEPSNSAYFEKVATDFEEANPGVTVEITAAQDDAYKDRIKVLTAASDLPDIYFAWPGQYAAQFINAGLASDLTEEIQGDWAKSFIPAALSAYEYDGKNYAVPVSQSGKFMMYNTQMFSDAGVKVPKTFEDLLSVCDTFTERDVVPISFGNQAGWPAVHYLTSLFAANVPQDTLNADFDPDTATWTDPGYVEAIDQLKELNARCFTRSANGVPNDASKAEIQAGEVPMYYGETDVFSIMSTENGAAADVAANWSFFPLPAATDATGDGSSLTGAPDGLLINSKVSAEKKALAVKFLKFLTDKQNATELMDISGRASAISAATDGAVITPQLSEAITYMGEVDTFTMWLDTVTVPDVAEALLAAGQLTIDGAQSSEDIIRTVQDAARG